MFGRCVWALGLAACVLPVTAAAAPITVNGDLSDWIVVPDPIVRTSNAATNNLQWTDSVLFGAAVADHFVSGNNPNSPSGQLWPGYGGHDFDMVAMYSGIHNNRLYLAFVTGFDIAGVSDPFNRPYEYFMGDVFIDFGSNGGWFYTNENNYNTGSWDLAFGLSETTDPNATSLHAYTGFDVVDTPQDVLGFHAGPYAVVDGTQEEDAVTFAFEYGTTENGMVDNYGNFYHVYEFGYTLSEAMLASILEDGGYSVFSTMNCGNDFLYLNVGTTNITDDPGNGVVIPLPPAAGMILLGMAGLGIRRRYAGRS